MKRQKIRKLLLLIMLLLFPVIIYYFSPVLILQGALEGIFVGSFVIFTALFFTSIFFGRFFCGYLCPMGGLQECAAHINDKPAKGGRKNYIKYIIWVVWIIGIILCFINKNALSFNMAYQTDGGISVTDNFSYIIYYGIILLVLLPSIIFGKRIFCHYFCWMAPFMVLGRRLGRLLRVKQLSLSADKENCISCLACDRACPMSLKVSKKVKEEKMYDDECILCGACIGQCPKKIIRYKFSRRK